MFGLARPLLKKGRLLTSNDDQDKAHLLESQDSVSSPQSPTSSRASTSEYEEEPTVDAKSGSGTQTTKNDASDNACITASFPSLFLFTLVLIFFVLGRQYVIDVLIYIDSLDWWESMVLFTLMFTLVSFPIMSGYILLNIACGYTYGFIYGAMTTSACVSFAIVVAHCVMRRFFKVS